MPGCLLLLVLVSILWSPVIRASQGGQLCVYAQAVSSYPQPPVAAAFIMGCFWTRTNRKVAWPPGGGGSMATGEGTRGRLAWGISGVVGSGEGAARPLQKEQWGFHFDAFCHGMRSRL